MRKLVYGVSLLLMASFSYAEFNFDGNSKLNLKEVINNIETPAVKVAKPESNGVKEWTVMVFVNAKNNLESFGVKDLNEMEMVGSSDKVNIIAELGRIKGYDSTNGNWTGCKRYYVVKDNNTSVIGSKVILETPKCDMGDWNYLVNFVNWTKTNYPAKRYVLIVWNHGSGWNKGANIINLFSEKGISYDDETNNHITTPQLRMALEKVGGVDIFAMDACLMQMIEVAYEIKDYTGYVVGSEETEPGDGYTYNTWLDPLVKNPGMQTRDLATVMVNSYAEHYLSTGEGATQSAIDAKALGKLAELTNAFVNAVINSNDVTNAKNARTNAQKFYYSSNKDLYHFVKLMTDSTQAGDVKVKGNTLLGYLKDNVIVHNRVSGSKYSNAYGLAVYIPLSYTTSYDELMWAKDTNWDDFIKWIK